MIFNPTIEAHIAAFEARLAALKPRTIDPAKLARWNDLRNLEYTIRFNSSTGTSRHRRGIKIDTERGSAGS